ncbi:LuxR C-terminal-related transcriptional regulator [Umezawaea tangerina]|uniref:LuxR family two component transcriptional regulator n=1 Tax=Umezawaea tangerina TaxID=84725 RepID=A0A2T0STP2_9PSEU|nr:response regulator transcription factor [Umezawaea tangerina]PRY36779.1 LuxR family two component transcriptional regulator [Umezawaea tangerina]
MIDVLVVDDNPIVRAALRGFLDSTDSARVVAEAGDGRQGLTLARRLRPAVTLLDHRMPVADGLSVLGELCRYTAVLVLTSDADPGLVGGMLRGGARGYLVHGEFDPDELLRAVLAVACGQSWLSAPAAAVAVTAVREQADRERARHEQLEWQRQDRIRLGLTRREEDVLGLVAEGLSNAAIARRLVLTEKTVKNHLHHAFTKLRVGNRTEAALRWTSRR